MDSIVEQQRNLHEELDKLVKGSAQTGAYKFGSQKSRVNAMHLQKMLLDRARDTSTELLSIYKDEQGVRAQEVNSLSGNEMASFYTKLRGLKDYHSKAPNEIANPFRVDILPSFLQPEGLLEAERNYEQTRKEEAPHTLGGLVDFSGEESYGRFLDLHSQHDTFNNIKCVKPVDYLQYLDSFEKFDAFPNDFKKTATYKKYVTDLGNYLIDFYRRAFPLENIDKVLARGREEFEKLWASRSFRGWEHVKPVAAVASVDLDPYTSASQLENLGMDRLKSGLMACGLKVGGTLQQRAQRLFSTKGVPKEQWPKSIKAKKTASKTGSSVDERKLVAAAEAVVYTVCRLLAEVRQNTMENVERKMARSSVELENEDEDEEEMPEIELVESDDEDDEPKKGKKASMVVGWDGKPIPYWLYRLHGLNVIYTCEICGNHAYRGPKNFNQHFTEWRHAHGMRQLGIPNTKHFAHVTNINDARKLWAALKDKKAKERFEADQEEEYEDSRGNIVTKKTYEDLLRQGLL
eukprot:m.199172 g.199172  ORF g.199172 m.199172 type:complete len:519 (+) comp13694_c5_seq1:1023-2579(+)